MSLETGELIHMPSDKHMEHSDTFLLPLHDLEMMGLPLEPSSNEDNDTQHPKSILMPSKINGQKNLPRYQKTPLTEQKDDRESLYTETPSSPSRSQIQSPVIDCRQFSVGELDLIQRRRREERERKHSNLQYRALMERLQKRGKSDSTQSRLHGFISQDINSSEAAIYRVKPVRRALDGAPILILPGEQPVDRLNEIFPSPNSNKFVLQFPCNPSEEFHIDDLEETDETSLDWPLSNSTTIQYDVNDNLDDSTIPCRQSCIQKINSIGIFDDPDECIQNQDSASSESSNANTSPNTKRINVNLKPKRRYGNESQKSSPCSTSSSNLDCEASFKATRPYESAFTSIANLNEKLYRGVNHVAQSTLLSLRPKKRFIISSTPISFADENDISTDSMRDLNRSGSFSSSRDGHECDDLYVTNVRTPGRRRYSSVSFQDPVPACRDGNSCKGKQSFAKQTYLNDGSIDRLTMPPPTGLTRASSCCTATSEDMVLSPSLSESNFRTPNPESVRRRYWFGAPTPVRESPMGDSNERRSSISSAVGLFLPSLFGSNFEEEEEDGLCIGQKNVSSSFFERVRDAFSS